MAMPRFSIKDLMLATTLVAVGLAIDIAILTTKNAPSPRMLLFYAFPFGVGGAMIGAGVFLPFRQTAFGAVIGFLLTAPLLFLMLCFVPLG